METHYPMQVCQDKELTESFWKLHAELVQKVIDFCKEHNLNIYEFSMCTTGLEESIKYGKWTPVTDSVCEMYIYPTDEKPYLFNA